MHQGIYDMLLNSFFRLYAQPSFAFKETIQVARQKNADGTKFTGPAFYILLNNSNVGKILSDETCDDGFQDFSASG
jgi:hypothetical protein